MMADHHPEELIDRAHARRARCPRAIDAGSPPRDMCGVCAAPGAWRRGSSASSRRSRATRSSTGAPSRRRCADAAICRPSAEATPGRDGCVWRRRASLLASGVTATAAIVGRKISSRAPVESPVLRRRRRRPQPVRRRPRWRRRLKCPSRANSRARASVAPRSLRARPAVTAAALFERAGKLRREGHADAAIAVYRRLQETFPDAREAQLSFALAGQLLLERGRPERRAGAVRSTPEDWRGRRRRGARGPRRRARAAEPNRRRDRRVEEPARTLSGIDLRSARARASGPAGRAPVSRAPSRHLRRVAAGHLLRGAAGGRGECASDGPPRRARRRAAARDRRDAALRGGAAGCAGDEGPRPHVRAQGRHHARRRGPRDDGVARRGRVDRGPRVHRFHRAGSRRRCS